MKLISVQISSFFIVVFLLDLFKLTFIFVGFYWKTVLVTKIRCEFWRVLDRYTFLIFSKHEIIIEILISAVSDYRVEKGRYLWPSIFHLTLINLRLNLLFLFLSLIFTLPSFLFLRVPPHSISLIISISIPIIFCLLILDNQRISVTRLTFSRLTSVILAVFTRLSLFVHEWGLFLRIFDGLDIVVHVLYLGFYFFIILNVCYLEEFLLKFFHGSFHRLWG